MMYRAFFGLPLSTIDNSSQFALCAVTALATFALCGSAFAIDDAARGGTPTAAPSPAMGVSLADLLAYADNHAPVLAVARSRRAWVKADQTAASVSLPTNPQVTVAVGPRFGLTGTGLDLDIGLMQQLQVAGERGLRLDVVRRQKDLTETDIDQLRWLVHCDIHADYHRALVDKARLELSERVVKFQREVLVVVERQIAAGEAAPLALRLAQAEVAQAEQGVVSSRQALLSSRLRLAQLSGWPLATPPEPGGSVDRPREPPPLDKVVALAAKRVPKLQVLAARVQEARARIALADRELWPKPSVGVQYRREGNPTSEGAYDIVMGVISVSIPTVQRNQGDRAKARADLAIAEAELAAERQMLAGQLVQARAEVSAAAQRALAYGTEILPHFEASLTLLRRSFELGDIDILALSTGRERFLRMQSDALMAQQDYFIALANLERVVGVELWHDDHHEGDAP